MHPIHLKYRKIQAMQKILSLLLIMIMSTLPLLSVSAFANSCQNIDSHSPHSLSNSEQAVDMSEMHEECCNDCDISCQHGGLCNCDSGQAAYSISILEQNNFLNYQLFPRRIVISDSFVSINYQSLYRPPITVL